MLLQIKALQEKNSRNNLLISDYVLAESPNKDSEENKEDKKPKSMPEASAVVASKDAQTTTTTTKKEEAATTTTEATEKVFFKSVHCFLCELELQDFVYEVMWN